MANKKMGLIKGAMEDCCCQSGKNHRDCCGPLLSGQVAAKSPQTLMRSRYSAFCHKDIDYLVLTLDPEKRGAGDRDNLAQTMASTQWLGLRIMDDSLSGQDRGVVEFVAFFEQDGEFGQLHEKSVFIRKDNRWFYREGDVLPPVALGRNQACVCGSGKKFKRCHGKS